MAEYCYRCQQWQDTQQVQHRSGVEYLCGECGWQVDFLHNEQDEDDYGEPVGSCDNCGVNLYRDSEGSSYCTECSWNAAWRKGNE